MISREKPTAGNRFSLLFTVDNKPGKLAEVIQVIGASGFNMESIKSRPMPHVPLNIIFMSSWWATPPPTRPVPCCMSWTAPAAPCVC